MDIPSQLAELEQRLIMHFEQRIANLVEYTKFTRATKLGTGDKTVGHPVEGDEKAYDHEVMRMQNFGLRSLPPDGVWCLRVGLGGGNNVTVAEEHHDYGPNDLKVGEAALYNKVNGCVIKLHENGKITINAPVNQNVELAVTGTGKIKLSHTSLTGGVDLGPGTDQVLIKGTVDSLGVPVTQNPAAATSTIKSG